jgi:DNA-binding transcriptional ArsR family regulator
MRARREFRNRRDVEVALLDALVDRTEEGMTVFELRAAVDADIDTIEEALSSLKSDGLITVDSDEDRVVILPDDRVVPDPGEEPEEERGIVDAIREKLGL